MLYSSLSRMATSIIFCSSAQVKVWQEEVIGYCKLMNFALCYATVWIGQKQSRFPYLILKNFLYWSFKTFNIVCWHKLSAWPDMLSFDSHCYCSSWVLWLIWKASITKNVISTKFKTLQIRAKKEEAGPLVVDEIYWQKTPYLLKKTYAEHENCSAAWYSTRLCIVCIEMLQATSTSYSQNEVGLNKP